MRDTLAHATFWGTSTAPTTPKLFGDGSSNGTTAVKSGGSGITGIIDHIAGLPMDGLNISCLCTAIANAPTATVSIYASDNSDLSSPDTIGTFTVTAVSEQTIRVFSKKRYYGANVVCAGADDQVTLWVGAVTARS